MLARSADVRSGLTLVDRIEAGAEGRGGLRLVGAGSPERVSWRELYDRARQVAAALQARGVAPGDRVAVLGPTGLPVVTSICALWLAGATVVVLPLPMRMRSIDELVAQTKARLRAADALMLLVDPEVAPIVDSVPRDPADPPFVGLDQLAAAAGRPKPDRYERPALAEEAVALLQFTSGSTAEPKGVVLSHAHLGANLDAIVSTIELDPLRDVAVSWLPLYHDMGLIGLLTIPLTTGADLVLSPPQAFLSRPGRWMEWMSDHGGTVTAGPSFAYALAGRTLARSGGLDLSQMRLAINGSEPIDVASVEAFCASGSSYGLGPNAMYCVYGLAEATLAVTFPEPGTGMVTDAVSRADLERDGCALPAAGGAEEVVRLVRVGRPLPGVEVRVVEPATGRPKAAREVGEIEVRGPSVTSGYFRNEAATEAAFRGGWLRTGDLGYLADGELVVCGRHKDVIIVGGRNVFPDDIERAAARSGAARAGCVVAFAGEPERGRTPVVVLAETRSKDPEAARREVVRQVLDAVGLRPRVVLLPPGALPKTSSGKLQRSLSRARFENGELPTL
jgi:fatty-acyl-CoA synthase